KESVNEDVYDDQIGMMEMVLDVDAICEEMTSIRDQFSKY
ncbi:glycine/sarcosine/betaine reductase complex selenoprotein A, partial [Streptococcus anginosus]|nr:glycine/sarcosine/betaine reductase complex selenoprotein A [Streptococcus anginosus]